MKTKNAVRRAFLGALAFAASFSTSVYAQTAPAGRMQSLSHAIHAVNDLETTLAFYRDVFGINGNPQDFANAAVPLLTNAPGVTLTLSMVSLPGGPRFEFTHFKGIDRVPGEARYTDPGAASLVFHVRDIDALVAAAKTAAAVIVTTGGAPVEIATANRKARSIMLRDPDGFFVQLVEEPAADGAPDSNIHRVSLAYTMEDADATRRFYTGKMGIELEGGAAFKVDPALGLLVGASESLQSRQLTGTLPPGIDVRFTEFRGVPRTKFDLRPTDPGAPAMAIQVTNIEGMVAQMQAAGARVLSANGELVDFGGGVRNIFIEDPNGLNLELIERPGGR
jgi:catechol 2,3-dioxygenase-like lactoylglutathione lyase family enzyme